MGLSGALIIFAEANFWVESYRIQKETLAEIREHIPVMPVGASLILDGVCPWNGPAPVFVTFWDLSGALTLVYGHEIGAHIVTRGMRVEQNGLAVPTPNGLLVYPFGELYIYHFGRKAAYAVPDLQMAQYYFNNISTDRAERCPSDNDGNGVDVLNGLTSKLRESQYLSAAWRKI